MEQKKLIALTTLKKKLAESKCKDVVVDIDDAEVSMALIKLEKARADKEIAEKHEREAKAVLEAKLANLNVRKALFGDRQLLIIPCQGKAMFDVTRFKSEHPRMYESYLKSTAPFNQYRISERKE